MSEGSTETSTSGLPEWAVPYLKSYYNKAGATADLPYQAYQGEQVAPMNAYTSGGLNAQANRAMQGSQAVGAANTQLENTLGGGYAGYQTPTNQQAGAYNQNANLSNQFAGSNPYLSGMIDQSSQDVIRNYNTVAKPQIESAMVNSGSFGNSGLQAMQAQSQSDLQKNLGNLSNQYRFQDYTTQQGLDEAKLGRMYNAGSQQTQNLFNAGEGVAQRNDQAYQNERNRQIQGIGLAPSLAQQDYIDASALQNAGAGFQAQDQAYRNVDYQNFLEARNYPNQQLATLGSAFGANTGTQTTTPGANQGSGILGGALSGMSLGSTLGIGALPGAVLGGIGGGK